MEDYYSTKDQDEITWLLLYNPELDPADIVEAIKKPDKAYTDFYFHFPDHDKQEDLIKQFLFSREREFALKKRDVGKFIRTYNK